MLQKWLLLMHWWARDYYPVTDSAQEAKISEVAAIQVYQYICTGGFLLMMPHSFNPCFKPKVDVDM